ncbi:MAG: hypothetical protein HY744_02810 [Deltaproteobacteria bacterium]|nr:hypothetical protein [Deltaproteobacteria bacterium]
MSLPTDPAGALPCATDTAAAEQIAGQVRFVPLWRLRTRYRRLRPGVARAGAEPGPEPPLLVAAREDGDYEVLDGFKRLGRWRERGHLLGPVLLAPPGPSAEHKRRLLLAGAPPRTTTALDEARVVCSDMNVRVALGGRDGAWRFQVSARIERWIESTPWLSDGGTRLVRLSGPRQAEMVMPVLAGAVRAADDGASDVVPCCVDWRGQAPTAETLLSGVLEVLLPAPGARRAFLDAAARALAVRPNVLVVDALDSPVADTSALVAGLCEVGASARKLDPHAVLTAMVLSSGSPSCAGDLALDIGRPVESALEPHAGSEAARWAGYVHHRLAWEAAGNVDRALAWDAELSSRGLRLAGESALEDALDALSMVEWQKYGVARDELRAFVKFAGHEDAGVAGRGGLEERRLVWRPMAVARVVPWAARAMLAEEQTPARRAQLRACLVCAPLRRDLLARCLDLEALVRARHARYVGEPPDAAKESFEAFRRRDADSDARYYPPRTLAAPDGPWAFAELGSFHSAGCARNPTPKRTGHEAGAWHAACAPGLDGAAQGTRRARNETRRAVAARQSAGPPGAALAGEPRSDRARVASAVPGVRGQVRWSAIRAPRDDFRE